MEYLRCFGDYCVKRKPHSARRRHGNASSIDTDQYLILWVGRSRAQNLRASHFSPTIEHRSQVSSRLMSAIRLPVDEVLEELCQALRSMTSAVLVAPPGAGKTTRVPPALLQEPWLGTQKILLLEPRRLAARAAAERMASLAGDKVGDSIGIRARLDTRSGPKTRIEVITEGVFTRLILDDPALSGIGAVIFDEFHERSLDADLGLALALDAQSGLREDLRILVMSATLDAARVAGLLGGGKGDAPVIRSDGRAFPVETRHLGRASAKRIEEQMADAIARAVRAEPGSLLAFLPGQAEIRRTRERLAERLGAGAQGDAQIEIVELHGGLDGGAQTRAIRPSLPGHRKIVLATAIAQTSITIEGVRIVVDCGLERVPKYEPGAGVTRLETVRVSRATADQRRGRAGRTEPGVCYRLWDEPETSGFAAYTSPEIHAADLTGLLLDCAAWGVSDPGKLSWLDPPSLGALDAAREDLLDLAAIDTSGALTPTGRRLRALPLPPRLACMLLLAADIGAEDAAADLAAVLVERGLGGPSVDLDDRLQGFRRDASPRAQSLKRLAREWARGAAAGAQKTASRAYPSTAALLALAYPDRIARARGNRGDFLLAGGRGAMLDAASPLSREPFLVIAELSGAAAQSRILLAARLDAAELDAIAGHRIERRDELIFDVPAAALRARRTRRLGAIVLDSEPRPVPPGPETAAALVAGIANLGIDRLPWTREQRQLRDRIAFLRAAAADAGDIAADWPDIGDEALGATIADWLAPFIPGCTRLSEIDTGHLGQALDTLIPFPLKRRLEAEAPTHFEAPTGNRHPIDYEGEGAPILAIRVQELFGLKTHPAIAAGRLPLTLHLLSPAARPMQITRDLPRFWSGSWRDVKADMKGRYPKHPWPDDPANAAPTARAKTRK